MEEVHETFPQSRKPRHLGIWISQEELDFVLDFKRNCTYLAENPDMNHTLKTEMLIRIFEMVAHTIRRFPPRPGMLGMWCNVRIHYLEHRDLLYRYAGIPFPPQTTIFGDRTNSSSASSTTHSSTYPYSRTQEVDKPAPWIQPDVLLRLDQAFKV